MAHFAKVENGIVTQVIVANQEFINSGALGDPEMWIQTSYNTKGGKHYNPETGLPDSKSPLRKNYAGIGYTYDIIRDAFIPSKPHDSWVLNEDTCAYEAPIAYPTDGFYYVWDENIVNWVRKTMSDPV